MVQRTRWLWTAVAACLGSAYVYSESYCPTVNVQRTTSKTSFRLVQYNVEWFFLDYYASSNCPGTGCSWVNESEAIIHQSHLADVLRTLDPDIVNMCEVEGCDELYSLNNLLNMNASAPSASAYTAYMVKGNDTSTGQNVGMITRIDPHVSLYRTEERIAYPVPGSQCGYMGSPGTTGVSKHYITEFAMANYQIAFFGLHFLAFPTDPQRCAEREAQAQVMQNVISTYVSKGYEIIVMGDFNDYDPHVLDSNGNKPTSQVLDIIRGWAGEYAGTYELNNLLSMVPTAERYSDWWDANSNCASSADEFSLIDHILVSSSIQEHVANVFIYHGYEEFCGTYESDHYPVVVDFVF